MSVDDGSNNNADQGGQGGFQSGPQETAGQGPGQELGQGPGPKVWFYAVAGQTYGPFTEGELIGLARGGRFGRNDFVYAEHIGRWVPAGDMEGLFEPPRPMGPRQPGRPETPPFAGPYGVAGYGYAGFWIRFLAVLIDGLILAVPTCCVGWPAMILLSPFAALAHGPRGSAPAAEVAAVVGMGFASLFLAAVAWLYFAAFESSSWQATPGKRAVGIVVTDTQGRRISFARATGRYFASWLSHILLNIGYIIGAFTPRKQTLHDYIANTVVVHGRRP